MEESTQQRKQDYLRFTKRARRVQTVFFLLVLIIFLFLADDLNFAEASMHYFLLSPVLGYQWTVRFLKYRYFTKRFDRMEVWDHLGLPYIVITITELSTCRGVPVFDSVRVATNTDRTDSCLFTIRLVTRPSRRFPDQTTRSDASIRTRADSSGTGSTARKILNDVKK